MDPQDSTRSNPQAVPTEPNKIFFKDFAPKVKPSESSCCAKGYSTFSEIVEEANDWLRRTNLGVEVLNCEVVCVSCSSGSGVLLKDTWPSTRYLRGLRLWCKISEEKTEANRAAKRRLLLGFRDFLPKADGRSIFGGQTEDTHQILARMNTYISTRNTPTRILALTTLDAVNEGYVDVNVDTDRTDVCFSQHGFTRFIRFMRIFFLTEHPKIVRLQSAAPPSVPRIDIKDFISKPEDANSVQAILTRALTWVSQTENVAMINLQVLSCKSGSVETTSTTWTLESPANIPNKFTTVVRVAFMSTSVSKCGVASTGTTLDGAKVSTDSEVPENLPRNCQNDEDEEGERQSSDKSNVGHKRSSVDSTDSNLIVVKPSPQNEAPDDVTNEVNKQQTASVTQTSEAEVRDPEIEETNPYSVEDSVTIENAEEQTDCDKGETISIMQDFESLKSRKPESRTFLPAVKREGTLFSYPQYESVDAVVEKINHWVSSSENTPFQIHTHFKYFKGNIKDLEKSEWVKYLWNGSWFPVFYVIVNEKYL